MGPWFWNCFLRGSIENQIGQLQISQNRKQTLVSICGFFLGEGCWLLELPKILAVAAGPSQDDKEQRLLPVVPRRSALTKNMKDNMVNIALVFVELCCQHLELYSVYGVALYAPIKTMNQTRAWISYNICNPSAALPGNGNGISLFVYIDCVPIRGLCFTNVHCFFEGNCWFLQEIFFLFLQSTYIEDVERCLYRVV